jgi:hypothetical protein
LKEAMCHLSGSRQAPHILLVASFSVKHLTLPVVETTRIFIYENHDGIRVLLLLRMASIVSQCYARQAYLSYSSQNRGLRRTPGISNCTTLVCQLDCLVSMSNGEIEFYNCDWPWIERDLYEELGLLEYHTDRRIAIG